MARQYTLHRGASAAAPQIDYAAELNPQQCAAVTAQPGPALVIAGAGSGKTRTLTYRVAYLIENGVGPQNILLLTFTNKAAREMLDRVAGLIPNDLAGSGAARFTPSVIAFSAGIPSRLDSLRDSRSWIAKDAQDLMDTVLVTIGIDKKDKRLPKAEVIGGRPQLFAQHGAEHRRRPD
jgi:DNA helicase-2/ATP-dependent DNA helicase PcrA